MPSAWTCILSLAFCSIASLFDSSLSTGSSSLGRSSGGLRSKMELTISNATAHPDDQPHAQSPTSRIWSL